MAERCVFATDLYCDDLVNGTIAVDSCSKPGGPDKCIGSEKCACYIPENFDYEPDAFIDYALKAFEEMDKEEMMTEKIFDESVNVFKVSENAGDAVDDKVNHPNHYCQGGIECIEAIKASMTPYGFQDYCKGNVMKYIWRYREKNGIEDLKKASVYLNWAIESVEEENKKKGSIIK